MLKPAVSEVENGTLSAKGVATQVMGAHLSAGLDDLTREMLLVVVAPPLQVSSEGCVAEQPYD